MISFKEFLLEDQNDNNNNKVLSIIKNNPTKTKIINTYYERLKNIFTFKDNDKTIIYYNNIFWCLQYLEQNLNSLKVFDKFIEEINHYQLYIPKVEFKNQKPEDIIAKLKKFYDEAKAKEEKNKGITPQKNDEILIKCKSGNSWWFIDRAYCPEEGRSGNHCGNVVGQHKKDQRILSLRNSANQVILTFILEPDNTLGEMKAKGNLKPSPDYHKDIMELLTHKPFILTKGSKKESFQITGISGEGYLPHMNFSIFDLSEKDLLDIHEHNPKFITDQIKINPTEILKSSDKIKQLYSNHMSPEIRNLINNPSLENWIYIISNKKYKDLIIYVPQKYWNDFPNYKEKLIDILAKSNDLLLKAPPEISKDFEILKEVISLSPQHIHFIQNTYKHYDELLIIAITKNADILNSSFPGDYISKNVATFILNNNPDKIGFVKNEYIPEGYKIDLKGKKNLVIHGPLLSSLIGICPEKVPGIFSCAKITNLTSLEGSPKKVGKDFKCYYNKITSLKYGPKEVGGDYICYINKLTSLEGAPEIIKGKFSCSNNQLKNLKYGPKKIDGDFYCSSNQLISLEGAPEIINDSFHCNDNKLKTLKFSPKEIKNNFWCKDNLLESLEGAPEKIGGIFSCDNNQLTSLKYGPKEVGSYSCTNNLLESLEGCPEIINGGFDCDNNKLTSLELGPKVVKGYYNCKNNSKQFTVEDVRKVCQVNGNIIV